MAGDVESRSQELRTVLKISLEDDKYKGTLYSIDQNPQPIPTSSFTKDGPVIKYTINAINGSYEGRLSADGNTITGTWTQFGNPSVLNLVRATPETAWTIPEPLPPAKTMAADAKPEFEVSTIKPSKPDEPTESTSNLPGHGRNPRGMMVMNSTITQWAAILGANTLATLDRPVVDQTGLGIRDGTSP